MQETSKAAPRLKCPQCGSERLYKDGLRYLAEGSIIQRHLCRNCGYRFSETTFNNPNKSQRVENVDGQILNSPNAIPTNCQGSREALSGASTGQQRLVQTLAEVEPRIREAQREGTLQSADIKGQLIEYIWYMKKKGYAESTIKGRLKLIKRLINLGADLGNPEEVKRIIALQSWCEGRKSNACDAYTTFLGMQGKSWERPFYKGIQKLPFIPQESEIDQLIAGCSPRMACFLQLLKETGMRPGEAWQLQWTDIDTATRTIRITPEKGSNPRIFHISSKLAAMLENLPRKYGNRIFSAPGMRLDHHNDHFVQQRKRIAHKLKNPRILQITFKTFRHWKATMEYHRTKDILHVKHILGHKNINNTLIYITLAEELFKDKQEYISKVAKNVKEACALIEAGFEYVTGEYNDGGKIFRKPKYT
ncbi:MAG: tyrosine-type recombinase/integrase [Candidatus Bathyarchaeia archaeon]